ncbi:hypothetical protein F2Q70_00036230 [Brassica cretica]|uniref:Protein kinase domain-containing protein n=1 Tax=Brassica cretica TaxID=69181 RepID=A0A8S9K0D0_BRACR|nr:hypothetical protein F2Q70_00036230 [Brassica cretica]
MGCVSSKGVRTNDGYMETNHVSIPKDRTSKKQPSSEETSANGNDATLRLIPNTNHVFSDDDEEEEEEEEEKKSFEMKSLESVSQKGTTVELLDNVGPLQPRVSRIASVTNGDRTAKVIAGWPSWLVSVAGEALSGWLPRCADSFEKLEMIGQGTYSNVYRARDLETNQIVALKKVRFANMDPESVRFMAREIIILRRLNHPNVMKLQGLIISKASASMYLVFEYMDHDLTGLASTPGINFSQAQIKCYMKQLMLGLEHCHSCGVLHRDIKGSNLLLDRNNNLKIADFGLSTFYPRKQPLTSRVVTLWYRPPELLLGSTDYGVTADLWSTGCILAELFTGKPLLPGRTEVLRKGASSKQNEQKRFSRESRAVPAPGANAELLASIQKRLGETNQTSVSETFNPEGDSGSGFRIEPHNPYTNGDNHSNGSSHLRTQRSYVQRGGAQLSRFSNSVAPNRDGSSQFGSMRDALVNQRWLEDGSGNCNLSQRLLENPNGLRKDDPSSSSKGPLMGYDGEKRERIHYSGPLISGEGNLDEMLKDHERQILLAVRRAQADKAKRDVSRQARGSLLADGS